MGPDSGEPSSSSERSFEVSSQGLSLPGGVVVPARRRGTIVLVHGMPSSAPPDSSDDGYPGLARRFAAAGWAAAWVRIRAAGAPGYFSIRGWVADARAGVEAARRIAGNEGPLALLGSSAGGAVSIELCREGIGAAALVLLASPAAWISFAATPEDGLRRVTEGSGMAVAPHVLADPRAWAREFRTVTPEDSIASAGIPVLIVHSSDDEVVPVSHAHRLARRAGDAEVVILEGAAHHLRRHSQVVPLVVDWLARVVG